MDRMAKPKQPLQAVRRGIRNGLRSLSPSARRSASVESNESFQLMGRLGRIKQFSNQNSKPVIRDEVIGRISPEKMRKEKLQQQQQRQDPIQVHQRNRDEQRDHVGTTRGRPERNTSSWRDQPSPPGRRRGGWDAKLEMPRGATMDHLSDFSIDPPPPPPLPISSSPRHGNDGVVISPEKSSSKTSRKKEQSRRSNSSSPSRRQLLQQQFEHVKGKNPPRSPQQQLVKQPQQPRITFSTGTTTIENTTSGSRSTFSRSQLIENPQLASSGSMMFSTQHEKHYRNKKNTPLVPPPPPPPPLPEHTTLASSPRSSSTSPWRGGRRQRDEMQPTKMIVQNDTATSSDADWRGRSDQWGATLNVARSMDSFAGPKEWVADFEAEEGDLWKFDSRTSGKSSKRSPRRRRRRQTVVVSSGSTDSRDQDVLDSRQEKYSSTFTISTGVPILPPALSALQPARSSPPGRDPRDDRDKKQRSNGFLNFFGGLNAIEDQDKNNIGKISRKGAVHLAAEMLEIGSDATVTAGDLIAEENSAASSSLSLREGDSKVLFPNDHAAGRLHAAPAFARNQNQEKQETPTDRSKPQTKAINLTGGYLQNKFLELESSHGTREGTDDHGSVVSNLTDPTVFKQRSSSPKNQVRESLGGAGALPLPVSSKQNPLLQSKESNSPGRHVGTSHAKSRSDQMDEPETSWDSYVKNGPLGRAYDMYAMSQTPTAALDVISPRATRPPLLPKSTISSTTAPLSDHQTAPSSSLPSRRGKLRSRTPSPSRSEKTAAVPSPLSNRSRARTPSPGSGSKSKEFQHVRLARKVSPIQLRAEAKKVSAAPTTRMKSADNRSKEKDTLIDQRVAKSKSEASAKDLVGRATLRSISASKSLAFRKQVRASSASPGRKEVNEIANVPKTSKILSRAQSASRVQPVPRKEASAQNDMSQRNRTRSKPVPTVKLTTKGRSASVGKQVQKMEPLADVMSRVPNSLGSKGGGSNTIDLKRRESAKSISKAMNMSWGADALGQNRRAGSSTSSPQLRQSSPARNVSTHVKVSRQQQPLHGMDSIEPSLTSSKLLGIENRAKNFSGHFNRRRQHLQTREQNRPHVVESKKTYTPTNAYSGRFTPKKKSDKVTEIRATRQKEKEVISLKSMVSPRSLKSLVSPRSPTRKQVPRHVGAEKLRNMIKLKNHFDGGSTTAGGFADAKQSLVQKSRHSNKSTLYGRMPSSQSTMGSHSASYSDSILPMRRFRGKSHDRMTMIRDHHGLIDSFSVSGSDLRSLRSAIQSRSSTEQIALSHFGDFDPRRYEESNIVDPMQRAGLRLLSGAVVPIQAAARRFLARRQALSKLWATLVVQARIRAFLEQRRYEFKIYSTITIQGAVRGMLVRDRLMFEDYCATEIQRHVRGHLAAARVYETIYKISLVQSQVRMRLAIRMASLRMYCVLKLQGVARGLLVRCRLKYAHCKATDMQRIVRGYLVSMRVFNELYKITLVQNRVRRKQALDKATMRMALILSLQALARGYLVRCRLFLAHYHAITIQRYTRGYLGTMRVYEEIFKIMLIQNFFRMKLALNLATKRMTLIIQVQANWRRYCVLRRMDYANYNARVIQRYVRGYISTLAVYEEIYKITLIQNVARMKQARSLAAYRMRMILQVQAIVRGFILRGRLEKIRGKAITIQSAWRAFYYRLVYQFKLLDIIILQSVWRRKQAYRLANRKRHALRIRGAITIQAQWRCYDARETYLQYKIEDRAATILQTRWRCYDTSMDYLHFLADVLIVQSMARRWFAMRKVTTILITQSIVLQRMARGHLGRREAKKIRSAITIQKTWRGFVVFADYMFKIADIVILQTVARRWFARRRANYLRHKIEHDSATVIQKWRRRILHRRHCAATTIQKVWRGLVQEADFTMTLHEYRAARAIQTNWRRFWKFSNYLICLDCSIRIQAAVRGFLARCKYADEQWGAVILQAAARGIVGRRRGVSKKMVMAQTLTSNAIGSLQSMAATVIQSLLRGFLKRGFHVTYLAARVIQARFRGNVGRALSCRCRSARVIQTNWRRWTAQELYVKSVSAIKVQKNVRRMIFSAAYQRFLAARSIQNFWRGLVSCRVVLELKIKRAASIVIQSAWRGYLNYTNYLFSLCDIVKVQSTVRRWQAKKKLIQLRFQHFYVAAAVIQKIWRGFYTYTCFLITLSEIIRIQRLARKYLERRRFLTCRTVTIQKIWRGYLCAMKYAYTMSHTIKIQTHMRRVLASRESNALRKRKQCHAAVLIQKTWKRYFCRSNYIFIVSDVIKVQKEVRRYLAQKLFFDMWEKHAIRSAVKIQTRWRCHLENVNYLSVRKDVIKLQAIVRSFLGRKTFLELFGERRLESACAIQAVWRQYQAQKRYRATLFKVCLIQQRIRYFFAMTEIREEASVFIQKFFRGLSCRHAYLDTRADMITVQAIYRRNSAVKQYRRLCFERKQEAALKIQSIFRGSLQRAGFIHKRDAILDIQRYWRGFTGRVGLFVAWKQHIYRIHKAALEIQRIWRGYVITQKYLYTLGSVIEIQSLGRLVITKVRCRRRAEAATKVQALRRQFLARLVMLDLLSKQSNQKSKVYAAILRKKASNIQRAWRAVLRCRLQKKSAAIILCFSQIVVAKMKIERKVAAHKVLRFFLNVRRKRLTPELLQYKRMMKSVLQIKKWYPVAKRLRERRRKCAARVILQFFQMVKAEVDREIEMELQRRRQRKKLKKRNNNVDDRILEIAWEKASCVGNHLEWKLRADGEQMIQETLNEIQSRSRCNMYSGTPRNLKQRGAPPMLELADALEDQSYAASSIVSGMIVSASTLNKPSPSRVQTFSPRDFDEDYCLEEAFLDAEIHSAKFRRKIEKRNKAKASGRRRSSNASVTSRASVSSRMSVGSRISISSKVSTGTRESRETRASRESGRTEPSSRIMNRGLLKRVFDDHESQKRK